MAYEIEDEIDWSDSPLGAPEMVKPVAGPSRLTPGPRDDSIELFVSETTDQYALPAGSPLPFTFDIGKRVQAIPTRAQRAQLGIHRNRRKPTKDDYTNFALYQANQKAYEAVFLKNFVAHALHPEQVAECFTDKSESCAAIAPYLKSVVQNISSIAEKMIWNAHCRAVNMLANDSKDGAPFLDVHKFGQAMFSDFCPDNMISVVGRMNESWHRAISEPPMVRMSTKQYPIGSNSSPLEEIDEVAEKVFNDITFTSALPTGRATKPRIKRRGKGQGMPGTALREEPQMSRGNWLAFPIFEPLDVSPNLPQTSPHHEEAVADVEIFEEGEEPQISQDLCNAYYSDVPLYKYSQSSIGYPKDAETPATQLEDLYERYGAYALESDRIDTFAKVPPWHTKLIDDHKRRLTEKWGNPPQTLQRVLPGIKKVIAEAFARGYRPTSNDYQVKVRIIEAREQRQSAMSSPVQSVSPDSRIQEHSNVNPSLLSTSSLQQAASPVIAKKKQLHVEVPRKRQKTKASMGSNANTTKLSRKQHIKTSVTKEKADKPLPPQLASRHPSGSTTLELHQILPPDAYFEPQSPEEKPAWRCGIKHAMGYYYNAGNRTACPGCFTNIKENAKTKYMDFYLPLSVYYFQPAPDITWTPSKALGKMRRSKTMSHNSRAKEAYWAAIAAGETAAEARQAGVEAVEVALRPRTPKELTPEPTPGLEPDLGPHPSGSTTMEHDQDIPECAYFEAQNKQEEYAWRCDVNHALGRYYLAGDKRSCPGCGSNRHGHGKQADMDFYMPLGVVVRQEAAELCRWTPRKPYKSRKSSPSKSTKARYLTHNQNCSKRYFQAIEYGHAHNEAVNVAIDGIEAELDAKQIGAPEEDEKTIRAVETEETGSPSSENTDQRRDSTNTSHSGRAQGEHNHHDLRGGSTVSLVPKKRYLNDFSDDEMGGEEEYEMYEDPEVGNMAQEIIEIPDNDEEEGKESSGSDSE